MGCDAEDPVLAAGEFLHPIVYSASELQSVLDTLDGLNLRAELLPGGESVELSYATQLSPEESAQKLSTRIFLESLIARLPLLEARIIREHYFEEKPYRQISKGMNGISKAKVCRLHRQAVGNLRVLAHRDSLEREGQYV